MRLITCNSCKSQFDVSSMSPGTSFVCGKCRSVLQVPEAGPVVQPISPGGSNAAAPPPTVSMTPDQVRQALQASRDVSTSRSGQLGKKPAAKPATAGKKPAAQRPAAAKPAAKKASAKRTTPSAESQRKLPKAMQKRAAAQQQQSAQRARGAAKPAAEPAAKPAGKKKASSSRGSSRSARGGRDSGDKKKSQTGLFVGIGVGVVVIGALGFMFLGGDEGGQQPDGGNGNATEAATGTGDGTGTTASGDGTGATAISSGGSGTTPAALDDVGKFLAMGPADQEAAYSLKLSAATTPEQLKSVYDHYDDDRLAANAAATKAREMAANAALRLDANLDWANEAIGRRNLRDFLGACIDECPTAFQFADETENAVQNRYADLEDGSPWVDVKEFREFEKMVKAVRERETSLVDDDRLVEVEKQKDWIRGNDLFKDMEIIARFEEPYVLFQQWTRFEEGMEHYDEQREEKANLLAKRDGIIFTELNNQFRNLFGERFKLPTLAEEGRLLRVLILWDRQTFDEWHRRQESGMSGLVRAYYSPSERHIVHYVGTDALREQDYYMVEGGRMQKKSDQVTFHEGTHQLMHEYGAIFQKNPLPSDPGAEAAVPPRRSMWFDEGLAEFMGSVEIDEKDKVDLGGDFYHNRILLERIGFARRMRRDFQGKKWPLSKMLLPNHNGEMIQQGAEILNGRGDLAANLFYAQAWTFVHFSWFYDNGKYRDNLLNYMERVLKNEHGPEALAKAYNLPSPEDFGDIEKEYDWYYAEVLRRVPGKEKNGKWRTPNTDPPEGTYDQDDGGGDYDDDYDSDEEDE